MPSLYAHNRFGRQLLPGLPADVRRPIQRCHSLYDMGLQGPDFFFYDSYLRLYEKAAQIKEWELK